MSKTLVASCLSLLVGGVVALVLMLREPMAGTEFFPLAKENSWKHLVVFSGGDYIYYMTETVIADDHQLSGGKSYVVAEEYEPLTTTAPEAKSTVAYFRKDGFWHRYPWLDSDGRKIWDTQIGQGTEQVLPSPYNGNATWKLGFHTNAWSSDGKQHMSAFAKATIEPDEVRVPAGIFADCLRVETSTKNDFVDVYKREKSYNLRHIEWYAKGVGLVKAISDEGEGTPIKSVTELVQYKVK
ncbi:MAG: hypothetical protein AB7G75_15880 [Candidatus Binatia bacterium]